VLSRRSLTDREEAFWQLVDASHLHDENDRRTLVDAAARTLGPDGFYNALSVVALFNFYNKFVDVGGVAELTQAGYDASGVRLAEHGYAPPPR
jgi:hypothetical protein